MTKHDVANNEQFMKIKEGYLSFRRNVVENFQFNGSAPGFYGMY